MESTSPKNRKRLLIIDGLNQFLRSYIVDPSLSLNGNPIGGVKGFLKIVQKLIKETKPDLIAVVWDGAGGSKRRKQQNSSYKSGRKPTKLNRNIQVLNEQQDLENRIWQQTRVFDYINCMPIIQLMEDGIEADDIIALVAQSSMFHDWIKIIVSSDKDFIQLCNKTTLLHRPIQKELLNIPKIIEEYGIHPNNFALARAIDGDKSDNLPGVPGLGLKTISNRFPFLKEEKSYLISDIVDFCKKQVEENSIKAYNAILDNVQLIEKNYKMMQLHTPAISPAAARKINSILENPDLTLNQTQLDVIMIEDGFGKIDQSGWQEMYSRFKKIISENK